MFRGSHSFGNVWYAEAFAQANWVTIDDDVNIKLISLEHFFATKITSWRGRANNDIYHRDAEDMVTVIDGVANIERRFEQSSAALKQFVREGADRITAAREFSFFDRWQPLGLPGPRQNRSGLRKLVESDSSFAVLIGLHR